MVETDIQARKNEALSKYGFPSNKNQKYVAILLGYLCKYFLSNYVITT